MFCKVYNENQKELEKCTTSIVCVSYESDLQLKQTGKIDFFINHQKKLLSLEPNPLSSSFYDTTLGLFGLDGYVQLI